MAHRRRRGPWTQGERLAYHLLRAVVSPPLLALPPPVAAALGRFVGRILRPLFPKRHRIARENLDRVFGDSLSPERKERIAFVSFVSLFEDVFVLFSGLRLGIRRLEKIETVRGREHLLEALSEGKGVIVLSGHLSNFPLAAAYLGRSGIPVGVFVRPMAFRPAERLVTELRTACGIRSFDQGASAVGPVRHLRAGGLLWFALDQDARHGIRVRFFGEPARTSPGPVRLARLLGAPVLPAFVHRLGPVRYELRINPPVPLPRGEASPDEIRADLETLLKNIEARIIRYPEEWLWGHRRWR